MTEPTRLVFLDTETTGLDPSAHEVWEIAYAVDEGPIQCSVLPHDLVGADRKALAMNGWAERGLTHTVDYITAGVFEDSARTALSGSTLVGANPAFDATFLTARWKCTPWHYRMIDIESYAMGALSLNRPCGLARIAERLKVKAPDHSAAGDVHTLRLCFRNLQAIYAGLVTS